VTYLTLALWAEGRSDGPFLRPLLRRVVIEHVLGARWTVDIAEEFIALPDPSPTAARDVRICAAVSARRTEVSLLFIHGDGAGSPDRARAQTVQPAIEQILRTPSAPRCVGVVPKHETEAWMLADRAALGKALGVDPEKLSEFPALDEVERLNDPKQRIASIRSAVRRGNRRLPLLDSRQIGEAVNLDLLRRLDAFKQFENELICALHDMRLA
jgi:hypothetical protein